MLEGLGADALSHSDHGPLLRISLPWIRALPLAAVNDVEVRIDGQPVPAPLVVLGDRLLAPDQLVHESSWWFVQDRLVLRLDHALDHAPEQGTHLVQLAFRLAIPYLQVGPDGPLTLPFHFERELALGTPGVLAGAARDVA